MFLTFTGKNYSHGDKCFSFFLLWNLILYKYLSRIIISVLALNSYMIIWHPLLCMQDQIIKAEKKTEVSIWINFYRINSLNPYNRENQKKFDLAASESYWWRSPAGMPEQKSLNPGFSSLSTHTARTHTLTLSLKCMCPQKETHWLA